ncbi:hypothetical protein BOX15_Mlig005453g3 [Macrostomum lignano]|uniref:Voltage-gated hydrogen channel 1 n=1 Tax=Macrostomum lignano TaxID=282301 RepID=A0A267H2I5_9PLAT|nr:hypothetical protein BOX15_Mlig005453g1 [Macrostomum lignano]PAA83741.1 hypothetical protein BOX15_Mlig005453g2 [Macrostomum lignano]PAA92498.1 hypothetical protein BOX15_Mlig005453g3 [Macrostomum lignano]
MTFPIHPNNYNSMLPAPSQLDEPNTFSEGIRRVRLLRSAQLECITVALVWIDVAMVTHQIVLDFSLTASNSTDKNGTDERPQLAEFSSDHPALSSRASTGLFIAITAMAFLFLLETIARNIYIRVSQKRFCLMNVCDLVLCAASFCINLSLLVARVTPLARDFVALLITFRLVRLLTLFGGLTRAEKRQILRMLDGYRREESFNLEQQRMLQTELENRTRECQDLRELVKSATLSRNRLRQKQMGQHQLKQEDGSPNEESCTDVTGGSPDNSRTGTRSVPDDSGHSSDSSPDSPPRETFGRGLESSSTEAPQIGIELAEVADSNPQPAQDELDEGGAFTSKF